MLSGVSGTTGFITFRITFRVFLSDESEAETDGKRCISFVVDF